MQNATALKQTYRPLTDATPGHSGKIRPPCLLVVEDESIVAMDLADLLEEMGYHVCATVDNGQEALSSAMQNKPDLILMDIVIKGDMDGVETAHQMARRFQVPVVFLTAYSDASTVTRAAQAAPYGYLTKPYQAKELRAAVEIALHKAALERQLRESERWFSATLNCVADGVVATDARGRVQFMNPAAESTLKRTLDQVRGCGVDEVIKLEDARSGKKLRLPVWAALEQDIKAETQFGQRLVLQDGNPIYIDSSAAPIRSDDGEMLGAVLAFRDASARLAAEDALEKSEARFHAAFDMAPVGMALVSMDGRFLQGNAAMFKLLNCTEPALYRLTQSELSHPDDLAHEKQHLHQLLCAAAQSVQFEKRYRSGASEYLWTLASVSLLTQKDQALCYLYQVHDMTARKAAEFQLLRLAHFDPLTGLTNRTRMRAELERHIVAARRNGKQLAVVFIDLDHFKLVNDTLGHEAGDVLLQLVAQRLRASVRDSDCVARLGGDEFVLLLPNISNAEDVSVVTEKIHQQFAQEVLLQGQVQTVGLSMGVSLFPEDGTDATSLLRCADSALYHAKEIGRGNTQYYRPELTAKVVRRVTLMMQLRHAIEQQEFVLHYQPIVSINNHAPLCLEALLRWNHPSRGFLLPAEFIGLAEESGLIVEIGGWALRQACTDAARMASLGLDEQIVVAVNISVRQFAAGNLVQTVREALEHSGLDARRLYLEITEQLMLTDSEQNLQTLAQLKQLGVRIAIDDFGVAYSSLSYLKRLGPDKIKIDGSFVRNVVTDENDTAIVRAIVAMGKSLRMTVVAECVETEVQRDFLIAVGCDALQGFLCLRPCTLADLPERLKNLAL